MNVIFKFSCISAIFYLFYSCTSPVEVEWISSTENQPWKQEKNLHLKILKDTAPLIAIDTTDKQQQIYGFGGCFNEMGWEALSLLGPDAKKSLVERFFGDHSEMKFSICRMPVGANDYAVSWYSLNDSAGDYQMKYFNIDRDRTRLIPYIQLALESKPDLKIWGSPWCPPVWMKTNGHYACRMDKVNDLCCRELEGKEGVTQFIMKPEMLEAYALYFSKYIQSYLKEGIPVYAVHVQNEPNSCQNFPSCIWKASDMGLFIGKYLGPRFREDGLSTEIWYGTIERPFIENIDTVLLDPEASDYIKGLGFQWAGKGVIGEAHSKYPGISLMQTESECGDGSNNWKSAEYTFSLIRHYLGNGANAYLYWNMILDETGDSRWGWKQNSLVSIHSETGEIKFNPEYHMFRHITAFVKPGARFLNTGNAGEEMLAFLNPGGETVIVIYNSMDEVKTINYSINQHGFTATLQPRSFNSFRIKST